MLLGLSSVTVFAQRGYQVRGTVADEQGPVIGATVVERGTNNGVSTGVNGDFVLSVSGPDATVDISCIGYQTVTYRASQMPGRILLTEDNEFLEEVVVIGYGEVKKTDATGTVSKRRRQKTSFSARLPVCRLPKAPVLPVPPVPSVSAREHP